MQEQITIEAWMKPLKYNPRIETKEFSSLPFGFESDIIHVSSDVYALVTRTQSPQIGVLSTFTISENGSISDILIDKLEFDTAKGYEPNIIHVKMSPYHC